MLGLLPVVLGLGALGGGSYYVAKNVTLASVKAEIAKIEADIKAEEQAIVAKIKAAIASL